MLIHAVSLFVCWERMKRDRRTGGQEDRRTGGEGSRSCGAVYQLHSNPTLRRREQFWVLKKFYFFLCLHRTWSLPWNPAWGFLSERLHVVRVPQWAAPRCEGSSVSGSMLWGFLSERLHVVRVPQWAAPRCEGSSVSGSMLWGFLSERLHVVRVPQWAAPRCEGSSVSSSTLWGFLSEQLHWLLLSERLHVVRVPQFLHWLLLSERLHVVRVPQWAAPLAAPQFLHCLLLSPGSALLHWMSQVLIDVFSKALLVQSLPVLVLFREITNCSANPSPSFKHLEEPVLCSKVLGLKKKLWRLQLILTCIKKVTLSSPASHPVFSDVCTLGFWLLG